jgi:hypothetical protein
MEDVSPKRAQRREYLGDGLYVELDGHQLKLVASDGIRDHDTVYLEPSTFAALVDYVKRIGEVR